MAKTCPSCGYSPIGPYTDNCPICAEPVRNVRSDSPMSARVSGLPLWAKWVIGGAALAVVLGGGYCGFGLLQFGNALKDAQQAMEKAQADAEAARKARSVTVSAEELLRDFREDPAAADRKYKGKYLELTGIVERSGEGRDECLFVILHAGDEAAPVKVECFFDYADQFVEGRLGRLAKGETVTVRGEYDGRVSHVQVRECELVTGGR